MGSPEPSPEPRPTVQLSVNGQQWTRLVLEREVTALHVRAPAAHDGVLAVELRASTWTRPGLTPELGVRVRRLSVEPAR